MSGWIKPGQVGLEPVMGARQIPIFSKSSVSFSNPRNYSIIFKFKVEGKARCNCLMEAVHLIFNISCYNGGIQNP